MQKLADVRTAVHIRHHYAAPPARVFDAWLTPRLAGLWLFATDSRPMVNVAIDARAGGAFCFVERRAGNVIQHRGHYAEIARPQRLVLVLHSPDCAPKEVLLGGAPKEVPLAGHTTGHKGQSRIHTKRLRLRTALDAHRFDREPCRKY